MSEAPKTPNHDSDNDPSGYPPAAQSSQTSELLIAEKTTQTQLDRQESGFDRFLSRIYGSLFTPQTTFKELRSQPSVIEGAVVVVLVNAIESLRLGQTGGSVVIAIIFGLIGWLIFAGILHRLASVFLGAMPLKPLLTLIAYGSLPWIFISPALSLGGGNGNLGALIVMLWFTVWQIWTTAVALGISGQKLLILIPLAISGGVVALIWASNVIKLLLGLVL